VGFEDGTVLEDYIRKQQSHPAVCKFSDDHPIYPSQPDFGRLKKGVGMVKISDFSAAVFGNVSTHHNHNIQALPFCAPEVPLEATWTYSVDIWNLGNVVRTLWINLPSRQWYSLLTFSVVGAPCRYHYF
jgi:serine/threonine-protein kinase SRPK3